MTETYQSKANSLMDIAVARLRALTDADGAPVFKSVEKRWADLALTGSSFPAAQVEPGAVEPSDAENVNTANARAFHVIVTIFNADGVESAAVQRQTWLVEKAEDVFRGQKDWIPGHFRTVLGASEPTVLKVHDTPVGVSQVTAVLHVEYPW